MRREVKFEKAYELGKEMPRCQECLGKSEVLGGVGGVSWEWVFGRGGQGGLR